MNQSRVVKQVLFQITFCMIPSLVMAQNDPAAASAFFNKAVEAMNAGSYEIACPFFEKSQSLEPLPGTQFSIATCWDRAGKIATAMANYEVYLNTIESLSPAARAKYALQTQEAKNRSNLLKPQVPELSVVVPLNAPLGTRIIRDGIELSGPSRSDAFPVDPGEHVVVVEAPGHPKNEYRFTVAANEKKVLTVVIPEPDIKGSVISPSSTPELPSPSRQIADKESGIIGTGRIVSIISVGAVGIAGLVVGSVTGISALEQARIRDEHCKDGVCDTTGMAAADKGYPKSIWSTVGFAVGGSGLLAAGILWWTRPKGEGSPRGGSALQTSVIVGHTGAAIALKGTFQ